MPIRLATSFNENTHHIVGGVLEDTDGTTLDVADISTAVYSLNDFKTGDIINSRTDVSFKSNIDASGNFTITFTNVDNIIVATGRRNWKNPEEHRATLVITKNDGTVLTESIIIQVINLKFKS